MARAGGATCSRADAVRRQGQDRQGNHTSPSGQWTICSHTTPDEASVCASLLPLPMTMTASAQRGCGLPRP